MTNHDTFVIALGSKKTKCATSHRSTTLVILAAAAAAAAFGILGCRTVWSDLQLQFCFFLEQLLENLDDVMCFACLRTSIGGL